MKTLLFLTTIILTYSTTQSQLRVLLVNDDDYSLPRHFTEIESAISDAGYTATVYNTGTAGSSPTAAQMKQYDLVIWYAGIDGEDLYFWNRQDMVNEEMKAYLDGGGMMWLMGSDVLYDGFGLAPASFPVGTFPHDYLGIQSYDAQSHADDNGTGVPQLNWVNGAPFPMLAELHWHDTLSVLWWVDACTPVAGAKAVYQMGPAGYKLSGGSAAVYYDNGTSKVFSCFFDPFYIATRSERTWFMQAGLDWFNSVRKQSSVDEHSRNLPREITLE